MKAVRHLKAHRIVGCPFVFATQTGKPLYPGLTTVALPNKQIGIIAVKPLLQRLGGQPDVPTRATLRCSIILRDSCATRPA